MFGAADPSPRNHAAVLRPCERDVQEPHRFRELLDPRDGPGPLVRIEVEDLPVALLRVQVVGDVPSLPRLRAGASQAKGQSTMGNSRPLAACTVRILTSASSLSSRSWALSSTALPPVAADRLRLSQAASSAGASRRPVSASCKSSARCRKFVSLRTPPGRARRRSAPPSPSSSFSRTGPMPRTSHSERQPATRSAHPLHAASSSPRACSAAASSPNRAPVSAPRTLASRPRLDERPQQALDLLRLVRLEHATVVDLDAAHPARAQRFRDQPALGAGADQHRDVRAGKRFAADRGLAAHGPSQQARDLVRGRLRGDPARVLLRVMLSGFLRVRQEPEFEGCTVSATAGGGGSPAFPGGSSSGASSPSPPGAIRSGLPPGRAAATGWYGIPGITNASGAANTAFTASTRAGTERQFRPSARRSRAGRRAAR